jgi:hypothetical protein
MNPIPPSVLDDLTCLVKNIRGKDTIISTYRIQEAMQTGQYPCILFWLAGYKKPNARLSCALVETKLVKPFGRNPAGVVRSWQVIS